MKTIKKAFEDTFGGTVTKINCRVIECVNNDYSGTPGTGVCVLGTIYIDDKKMCSNVKFRLENKKMKYKIECGNLTTVVEDYHWSGALTKAFKKHKGWFGELARFRTYKDRAWKYVATENYIQK